MSPRRSPLRAFAGRFTVAFVVAALLMGGAVFTVNYVIDRKLDDVARVDVATADAPPEGGNYLVIGSDTRAFVKNEGDQKAFGDKNGSESGQRSDTMMVVHVEPGAQRTLVISFPRDLWVNIPGIGNSKINAAFNKGPSKVIETLKTNFDIDINHYLEVDFRSFQGIVKAIGNVPVYFPYSARDDKTGLFVFTAGCVRLDGPASLAYVRSRHLEYYSNSKGGWLSADATADLGRIARQQDFIRRLAGLAVAKSLNDPLTANEIADRVLENLTIDKGLTKDDIFALIDAFRTVNPDDQSSLEFATFPWKNGPSPDGQSVLFPRDTGDDTSPGWHSYVDRLKDFTGNTGGGSDAAASPKDVSLKVLNASGTDGAATGALNEFIKLGFKSKGTGDDPRGTVAQTEVRYKPGADAKGRLALQYVDPTARLVRDPSLKGADVAVVLGTDFVRIIVPAATSPTTAGSGTPTTIPATGAGGAPIQNQSQLGEPAPRAPPC
jgi:polyisoprenyl-teichoic acid--peptidoglycan teichoic acid transferase